jgi:serine/threonine protein kinase/tetratricopeptide (TPR) repeat protein
MNEKTDADRRDVHLTTDVPRPDPSDDLTVAHDPSTNTGDTPAGQRPLGEPPVTQANGPASPPDRGLPFLRPGTRPGSLGRLGHFEVLELLGKGGFGIVLKAFDNKLQRTVAIKVLGPQLAGSATARSRFLREARAAAAVNSKHVVSTYEVEEKPIPYLVMEYVAGTTLQDRIDQGPLETREVIRLGAEIAEGLAAAHKQGLIHRDIKPANILLTFGRETPASAEPALAGVSRLNEALPKIADFGLARAADDASLTQAGVIAGTPMFMSPEQARGEALDQRSDLFSLGSVLYTMCTGQPPFRAAKTLGVLKRVCDDTPRPIREINADIPGALATVVNRLLVKEPDGRFQTAAEVADLLHQHLAALDEPSPAPARVLAESDPPPRAKRRSRPPRRTLIPWVAAAAALLVVVGGLGLFLLLHGPTEKGASQRDPGQGFEQAAAPPTQRAWPDPAQLPDAAGAAVRGHEFCRRGQWALAAKESLAEVAARPGERMMWSTAAARLILAGDRDGYRQLCGRMIEQFGGTTLAEQADSLCKVCLLLPDSADRSRLPSRVLIDGVEQGTARADYNGYFYAGMALIAYRDGRLEKAAEYGEKSVAINHKSNPDGALALLALAMARHQLRRPDQARASLAEATALIPVELATLGSPEFQGTLPVSADAVGADWLIAEILRREAALLILNDVRRPMDAAALRNRGQALINQGKLDDALTAFRQALEKEERHGWTHYMVGLILVSQEKADEAIPEFRRAIEVADDYPPPYVALGVVLANQGKTDEAIAPLEKAVELEPKFAAAHRMLAELLLSQGKMDEAAARLSKALQHAPQDASVTQLNADVRRLQGLLPKLDQFVGGTAQPADNGQRLDLARLCFYRQRFAAAARFYAAALDADPKLADDPTQGHRYNAACAAARAGHGDGDAAKLDAAERSRLRKQAITWLRADLDAATKLLDAGNPGERLRQLAHLRHWKLDSDLASLRDADHISKLPDDERALLKGLWSDLDAALKRGP